LILVLTIIGAVRPLLYYS